MGNKLTRTGRALNRAAWSLIGVAFVWVAAFYLSQAQFPLPIGMWNFIIAAVFATGGIVLLVAAVMDKTPEASPTSQ